MSYFALKICGIAKTQQALLRAAASNDLRAAYSKLLLISDMCSQRLLQELLALRIPKLPPRQFVHDVGNEDEESVDIGDAIYQQKRISKCESLEKEVPSISAFVKMISMYFAAASF